MSVEFIVDSYLGAVKKEGAIAGPVFYRLFSKYTTEFAAKKIGETPPDADSLDQARKYLVDTSSRKSNSPYEAMVYVSNAMGCGVSRAEAYIAGSIGPISRRIIKASVEDTLKVVGMIEECGKLDAYSAAKKFLEVITTTAQYFNPSDVSVVKDGQDKLAFDISHCPGSEICRTLQAEGVKRIIGEDCQMLSMLGHAVEFLVGTQIDYAVVSKQLSASDCKMMGNITLA